uniref:Uncharacterized protein n=1 Tax=Setaria italica TaxID=4555 RepID=K3Z2F4_SETIT
MIFLLHEQINILCEYEGSQKRKMAKDTKLLRAVSTKNSH